MILGAASRITSTPSIIFDRWINDFEKWTRAVQRAPDIFTKCIDLRSLASRIHVTRNFKRFRAISFLEKYFEKKKKRRKKTKTKFPKLNEKNMEMFNEKNCYFLIECCNHSINLISFSKNFEEKNKKRSIRNSSFRLSLYHSRCCYSCQDKCRRGAT